MEEKIPYIAHEGAMARMERTIKRLIITVAILAIMLFACNACWLYAWCQYDYESSQTTTTVTQDGEGSNVYGDENNVNGADNSKKDKEKSAQKKER